MKISTIILLISAILFSWVVKAQIYERQENGVTTFSDQKTEDSKEVTLMPVTTISTGGAAKARQDETPKKADTKKGKGNPMRAPTQKTTAPPISTKESVVVGYKSMKFTNIVNDQTFWNQRDIPVTIETDPTLQPGDKIQLYVDGKSFGNPVDSNSLTVTNLDRGQHQLEAKVIDKNGQELISTGSTTIYIHYAALGGSG